MASFTSFKASLDENVKPYEMCNPGDISQADLDKVPYPMQMRQFKESKDAPVKSVKQIRQKTTEGSTLEVVFDVGSVGVTYVTGANSAIFPENDPSDVSEFAKLCNISESTLNKTICLRPNLLFTGKAPKCQFPIPSIGMTVREILTKLVGFHEELSIKDYQTYADCCKVDTMADEVEDGGKTNKAKLMEINKSKDLFQA